MLNPIIASVNGVLNKYRSKVFLDRTIWLAGSLIIVLAGFFFLSGSAQMSSDAKLSEQNILLGKLAFSRTIFTASGAFVTVNTANSDGSGQVALTGFPPSATQPAWSPDASQIAYVAFNASSDIYVMNANGTGQTVLTSTMSAQERNPSWSVTGKIAYERDGQIWTMNANGTNQAVFAGISQPSPSAPEWSPDGAKLAFSSGGEIWVVNSDGTNEFRVTTNTTTDTDAAWSPDGLKIAFTKGPTGIGVVNIIGTNELNLTNGTDSKPCWSSDNTKIAFVRRGTSMDGIYTMDISGANQVRVIADVQTNRGTQNDEPVWQPVAQTPNTFIIGGRITRGGGGLSNVVVNLGGPVNAVAATDAIGNYQFSNLPAGGSYTVSPSFANHFFTPANRIFNNLSGNQVGDFIAAETCSTLNCARNGKIAFVRNADIFTMNADGTNPTNITNNPATDGEPNYSPDGTKIIFASDRDGTKEIYQMNADGGAVMRLTNNTAQDASPVFSADGATIVFVSNRDGNSEIYKMNADGTNQIRLTTDAANDLYPSFSPDGLKIIFVTERLAGGRRLFTMNSDGTNQTVISNIAGFYNRPSYSPDGSKIIFVYGADVTAQTIFTMNADGTNRVQFPVGRSSPTYSPDGAKVAHVCCFGSGQLQDGIRSVNADGTSPVSLTLGAFDDFPDWQPILSPRRTPFDFDGDGRADVSVFRPSDRIWYLLGSQTGFSAIQFGLSDDVLAPADYDGDLRTDVAVWRGSTGDFYIYNSSNGIVRVENFGLAGDIPTVGDWDGDGRADPSVYRGGAQGTFYYRGSSGNPNGNISVIPWGIAGDKPVSGDFDGDGRQDAAIFRPSNGTWYVRKSSDGQLFVAAFGLAGDRLVPGDYDADGKTDFAVFRDGVWYLQRSLLGFAAFQYGIPTDIPAPADFDGDGRADAAVYRNGVWWILQSTSGNSSVDQFGVANDKPIPAAFLP